MNFDQSGNARKNSEGLVGEGAEDEKKPNIEDGSNLGSPGSLDAKLVAESGLGSFDNAATNESASGAEGDSRTEELEGHRDKKHVRPEIEIPGDNIGENVESIGEAKDLKSPNETKDGSKITKKMKVGFFDVDIVIC